MASSKASGRRARPAGPPMTSREKKAVFGLSFIYMTRMLGLFMLMPVLALDAHAMRDSTPFLLGLAVGIYGLAQAILQFPFGSASDRFGRKPVLIFGLLLFILGSVLGAVTDNIWGVVLARVLQGAGAVSSVLLATAGDLTDDAHRTKAMAAIGGSISVAYVLGMALGPIIYGIAGLAAVFWGAAVLGALAFLPLLLVIPQIPEGQQRRMGSFRDALRIFAHPAVQAASVGIFILQMVLGASFVVLSPELLRAMGVTQGAIWEVYLPVMFGGIVVMLYPVIYAEKHKQHRRMLAISGVTIAIGALLMGLFAGFFWPVGIAAIIFFGGYNIASAILPSMMSRSTAPEQRGAASGVYSLMQFLGIFAGGVVGGWGLGWIGVQGVFYILAVVGIALALQSTMAGGAVGKLLAAEERS